MNKEPPLVLVKTWYELLINAEDDESRQRAQTMLLGAFGSAQAAADYLKALKII